ncbi:MAG: phosphosulfolactate synthase [Actinomycetota bacterium]
MDDARPSTGRYLAELGVDPLPPRTSPIDPGYDPATLEAHLEQSAHLMSILKLSMTTWLIADEAATRRKIAAAGAHMVPTIAGGGAFEIAVAQNRLHAYLDLCAELGFDRVECGEGFTDMPMAPAEVVQAARDRGVEVEFELGKKHEGAFTERTMDKLLLRGGEWLDAGALALVIEARESASGVGLFDEHGNLDAQAAQRFADEFGLDRVIFEAPAKRSQFALLDHFGPEVHLSNVRLEEILRVEIYRRGLHADSFRNPRLSPRGDALSSS